MGRSIRFLGECLKFPQKYVRLFQFYPVCTEILCIWNSFLTCSMLAQFFCLLLPSSYFRKHWNQNPDIITFVFLQKWNKKEANRCFFHSLFFVLYILIQEAFLKRDQILTFPKKKGKRFRGSQSCSIWSSLTPVAKQFSVFDHHPSLHLSTPDNFFVEDQDSQPLCFIYF